jgi:hypothetical protein
MKTSEPVLSSVSRRAFLIGSGAAALAGAAIVTPVRAQSVTGSPPAASPVAEQPSKDATAEQLAIAKAEGQAYGQALASVQESVTNQDVWVANYQVIVLAKKATGMWMPGANGLEWTEPGDENAHIEVAVRDATDGRFIPGLSISVSVTAPDGTDVGTNVTPFVWHPFFYHYGLNWVLPADGDYKIHVKIDAPEFGRHDQVNGQRYVDPVELDVTLPITTGHA